jgi:hypothetical protein
MMSCTTDGFKVMLSCEGEFDSPAAHCGYGFELEQWFTLRTNPLFIDTIHQTFIERGLEKQSAQSKEYPACFHNWSTTEGGLISHPKSFPLLVSIRRRG